MAELEELVASRADELRLTPPRAVKLSDTEQDLRRLFLRLVADPPPTPATARVE